MQVLQNDLLVQCITNQIKNVLKKMFKIFDDIFMKCCCRLLFPVMQVYTFGCNDEGALGRDTSEEGTDMVPGKVELAEKVVQVSAGDSHTAALTEEGVVFIWGSFRVSDL